jgi:hypothetical protein
MFGFNLSGLSLRLRSPWWKMDEGLGAFVVNGGSSWVSVHPAPWTRAMRSQAVDKIPSLDARVNDLFPDLPQSPSIEMIHKTLWNVGGWERGVCHQGDSRLACSV